MTEHTREAQRICFFSVCSVCSAFQAFPLSHLQRTAQTPGTALLSFALVELRKGELCWNF